MSKPNSPHWAGAKRDKNEPAIVKALLAAGASVERISIKGAPDLDVGFRGEDYKIEVKMPGEDLTDDQVEWWANWQGKRPTIAQTEEQALRTIGAI